MSENEALTAFEADLTAATERTRALGEALDSLPGELADDEAERLVRAARRRSVNVPGRSEPA